MEDPTPEEEDADMGTKRKITPKVLKQLIKEQKLYTTPELNDIRLLRSGGRDFGASAGCCIMM